MNRFQFKSLMKRERNMAANRAMNTRTSWLLAAGALISICFTICLITALCLWMDTITVKAQLLMKGFAGLFAIISIIFAAIYMYRINAAFWKGSHQTQSHRMHSPTTSSTPKETRVS